MGVTPETARSYHRETVILPDGRRITGWPPGAAGGQLLEHRLRDNLATQLGGITEAQLPYGRADVLTKDTVFEVEPAENWRHGVRQSWPTRRRSASPLPSPCSAPWPPRGCSPSTSSWRRRDGR
jgi:hypothetical protein